MNRQEKDWFSDKKQAHLCLDREELRPSQNLSTQTKRNESIFFIQNHF